MPTVTATPRCPQSGLSCAHSQIQLTTLCSGSPGHVLSNVMAIERPPSLSNQHECGSAGHRPLGNGGCPRGTWCRLVNCALVFSVVRGSTLLTLTRAGRAAGQASC